jgi:chemotaxis protein MotB
MKRTKVWFALGLAVSLLGCGHSEKEWQAQLDKYNKLSGEHQNTQTRLKSTETELAEAKAKVEQLLQQLQANGVDITKLQEDLKNHNAELSQVKTTLQDRERALALYKARAKQLEAIKARFELLKKKLDQLTKLGLNVTIRHNRMVISLPGDVVFDSGKETLRKDGKDILLQVAKIFRADSSLLKRDFQVAGHTDARPYAGPFRDNWGLSVMRAREVLVFLVSPKGGGLPQKHWSAAGYAATDPMATNSTEGGRQKNRRCDLIVVPSVEEMLDLKEILHLSMTRGWYPII